MLILGIDPSLCHTGLAILDADANKIIYKRTLNTGSKQPIETRLYHIFVHVRDLINNTKITEVAIETQFMGKHASALKVAAAYAACILGCQIYGVFLHHYSPKYIKKKFTGYANADKSLMINSVALLYGFWADDSHIADAVAVAHVHKHFPS